MFRLFSKFVKSRVVFLFGCGQVARGNKVFVAIGGEKFGVSVRVDVIVNVGDCVEARESVGVWEADILDNGIGSVMTATG